MYFKLQSVLEEEQKAVISRDYKSLYELLSNKERILADIRKVSAGRSAMVASMLRKCGGGKGAKGLTALTGLLEGLEKSSLTEAGRALFAAMEKTAAMNKRNSLLIGASLENLGRSLDFLEAFFLRGTYESTGLVGGKTVRGARYRKGV